MELHNKAVLVVDDDRSVRETLVLVLQHHGFTARSVDSGEAALFEARQHPPNVAILDILLPGLNGIESALRLRQALPTCRILLISGGATATDMLNDAAAKGHFFEVLAKPTAPDELIATLERSSPRKTSLYFGN